MLKVIPEIMEEHLEEVAILWSRRSSALRPFDALPHEVMELDDRLEAHVSGLIVGAQECRELLAEALAGEDSDFVFASAYVLLRLQEQAAADLVMDTLMEAQDEQADGLRHALSQGPLDLVGARLKEMYESGPPRLAAVAAEVFASRGRLQPTASRLREFYDDDDPAIRLAAWRITALVATESTA